MQREEEEDGLLVVTVLSCTDDKRRDWKDVIWNPSVKFLHCDKTKDRLDLGGMNALSLSLSFLMIHGILPLDLLKGLQV